MKIDRLIGILTILLQQEKTTAPELAQRFEVSRRTISRDIEDICRAGIPLVTTQGYGGGISIADGYKIDKSLLTQEEFQALFAGLRGLDSISRTPVSSNFLDKLSSTGNRITLQEVILIDLASHYQEPLTQKIEELKKAILGKRLVAFRYFYEKGECLRTAEPYYLLFQWSSWYLFGYCVDKKDFRRFKLQRLWDLEILDEHFVAREIPNDRMDFHNTFHSGTFHFKAEFRPSEKYRLIDEYGADCYSPCENGTVLFEWDFTSYENMRQWTLSFGDRVRVLEPERLKHDLRQQAKNILTQYQDHDR